MRLIRLILLIIWTHSLTGCGSAKTPVAVEPPKPVAVSEQPPADSPESNVPSSNGLASNGQSSNGLRAVLPFPDNTNRPHEVHEQGYVSSEACKTCHPQQYASWHDSYHRTMTQLATPETVHGDFDNAITHFGTRQRFYREGDQFKAEVAFMTSGKPSNQSSSIGASSPREVLVEMTVAMVTGSHHQQVYWYPTGHGRLLDQVPYSYVFEEKRWVPRNAVFLRPGGPDRPEDWQVWSENCIRCHSTLGRPRNSGTTVDTEVVEFGISCEACHGPAKEHVEAKENSEEGTIIDLRKLTAKAASQACGQCHGVWDYPDSDAFSHWNAHGFRYRPGDEIEESRTFVRPNRKSADGTTPASGSEPAFIPSMFWSDGMVRVSGREYNGLANSPCFERGELSCLSCHAMHQPADDPRPASEWANDQLKLGMDTNQACLQCHGDFESSDKLTAHSHHAPESAGSLCYNCHMPNTTWGLLKTMRSHQIDSPDVANDVQVGRPNACNLCHLDQSLEWSATHLKNWYGIEPPTLNDDQQKVAAGPLWLLSGDAGLRAVVATSMNWPAAQQASQSDWMAPFLAQLLIDPYPAVRLMAHRALRRMAGYETFVYDYVGTNKSQEVASREAREIWDQGAAASKSWSDPLSRAFAEFARLLGMRDDRPVFLLE